MYVFRILFVGFTIIDYQRYEINLEFPRLVRAAVEIRPRVPQLVVHVAAVGADDHVPGRLAPRLDAVPADAAAPALDRVLGKVIQEHRVSVLAEEGVVHGVLAPGEAALGAAEASDLLHLLVVLALALR